MEPHVVRGVQSAETMRAYLPRLVASSSLMLLVAAAVSACGDDGSGTTGDEDNLTSFGVRTELAKSGALVLRSDLPALVSDCVALAGSTQDCADGDKDGLTDRWEKIVLERLRPLMRFD